MNSEIYTQNLERIHSLSAGLKAYIATIALRSNYEKGQKLGLQEGEYLYFPLLEKGQANIFAVEKTVEKKIKIGTYYSGDFLINFAKGNNDSYYEIVIEFLDDSSIIGITEKHFSNLMRVFLDAYLLSQRFSSLQFDTFLRLVFENNIPD